MDTKHFKLFYNLCGLTRKTRNIISYILILSAQVATGILEYYGILKEHKPIIYSLMFINILALSLKTTHHVLQDEVIKEDDIKDEENGINNLVVPDTNGGISIPLENL